MRTEADIFRVRLLMQGSIELDLERIEDDPNWRSISARYALPEQTVPCLEEYVLYYVSRERFLRDMPSTNGPGSLVSHHISILSTEVVNGSSSDRNTGS